MSYNKNKIVKFLLNCNDLIEGKFILVENKIKSILEDVSNSEEITELLNICLKNFNFSKELMMAKVKTPTKPGYFVLPKEREIMIPLVFCLLVDIENHTLDFSKFLNDYFSTEGEDGKTGYLKFGNEVIKPFKNAIADCFEIQKDNILKIEKNDDNSEKVINKENENINELQFFKKINNIVDKIIDDLKNDFRSKIDVKEDALFILKNIKKLIKNNDIDTINALLVGYSYILPKLKNKSIFNDDLFSEIEKYYITK